MAAPDAKPTDPQDIPWLAALELASHGYRVLPIRPGEKRPPMAAWQDAATNKPDTIRNWWYGLYRGYGVGIATGHLADGTGFFALDIDERDSYSGQHTLLELEQRHHPLPDTVTSRTGSGSEHRLYRTTPGKPPPRNSQSGTLGPGLDIRGENGQIVVAPSIHPNGTAYRWVDGKAPGQIEMAVIPDWFYQLITTRTQPTPPATPTTPIDNTRPSPADWYNQNTSWPQLLQRDGWTWIRTDPNGEQHWTRPGKNPREGTSATVGYNQLDILHVFTSSIPHLAADRSYSRFQYEAATNWHNDYSALSRHIQKTRTDTAPWPGNTPNHPTPHPHSPTPARDQPEPTETHPVADGDDTTDPDQWLRQMVLNWDTFWTQDLTDPQWILEPIIPENRSVAIFAPGGTGKSLLLLWLATTVAAGHVGLDGTSPTTPRNVLYLDYEMTADDLQERLTAMGYGPETDLSRLHYAMLPPLPPADLPEGGKAIVRLAQLVNADLVILDTFGRAVAGDENDADTTRAFYRWTGLHLKADKRAFIRLDHAGKDLAKGQRGSSAKNDDVDIVWQLTRTDHGIRLLAKKRRMGWIPETIDLTQHDEPELRYRTTTQATPKGTARAIEDLDNLEIPVDISSREAAQQLRNHNRAHRNDAIRAAQQIRKQRQQTATGDTGRVSGRISETDNGAHPGAHTGAPHSTPGHDIGRVAGRVGAHPAGATGARPVSPDTGAPSATPEPELDGDW